MLTNEKYPQTLPPGTVLAGQYIVGQVLGHGGFGVTYEVEDFKTGEKFAVKEFFPETMAARVGTSSVKPFTGEKGEIFSYGKTCFLQEAKTLANFIGIKNIVRIYSYFEENGTAYYVMELIEGIRFDEYIKQHGGKISFKQTAKILIPIMDALDTVHSKGIIHRDISPDNIFLTTGGGVKLLDFGAARYSIGDRSQSMDVILKHGFAPKEQYNRRSRQGPFTDIYALGATFYFALTGKRPPDSVKRVDKDSLVPPRALGVEISPAAEKAILKALAVQPGDRFQRMADFKNALLDSQMSVPVRRSAAEAGHSGSAEASASSSSPEHAEGPSSSSGSSAQERKPLYAPVPPEESGAYKKKKSPAQIAALVFAAVVLLFLMISGMNSCTASAESISASPNPVFPSLSCEDSSRHSYASEFLIHDGPHFYVRSVELNSTVV